MKLRTTLIALACAAVGSAHALTPAEVKAARTANQLVEVRVSGASALRLMVGAYLQSEIADPATFDVFFNSASGSDHRAYSFRTKADIVVSGETTIPAGTAMLVTKRDAGGSSMGVTPLVSADPAVQNIAHILVDDVATCTATANPRPATDITRPTFTCTGTVSAPPHAGLSDVEPALLQQSINGGTGLDVSGLDAAGFVQNIFGIAVNKKLYLALQKAQGLVALSATAIDESPAAQPSIPKSFVTGTLTGTIIGSGSNKNGWNLLIPDTVDAGILTKRVNVCRRTAGSGTQAASNMFFADNGCGSTNNAHGVTAGSTTLPSSATGTATTYQGSSSALVESCLGTTVEGLAGNAYGLGVLGRENNPTPVDAQGNPLPDRGYRFVKLSGVAPGRDQVIAGNYEFVVESSMQWVSAGALAPTGLVKTMVKKMRGEMGKASVLRSLDVDLRAGLAALPGTYTGGWSDLAQADREYSSHTARKSANSCSPVRMTK